MSAPPSYLDFSNVSTSQDNNYETISIAEAEKTKPPPNKTKWTRIGFYIFGIVIVISVSIGTTLITNMLSDFSSTSWQQGQNQNTLLAQNIPVECIQQLLEDIFDTGTSNKTDTYYITSIKNGTKRQDQQQSVNECPLTDNLYREFRKNMEFIGRHGQVPGNKRPTGDRGPIGNKGPTGDRGPIGNKGPTGDKGPMGNKGPTGDKGPMGNKGPTGDRGPIGNKGPTGDKGPMGNKGPTGDEVPMGNNGLCNPDWILFDQHCYYFADNVAKSWYDAQKACQRRGGNLVKIYNSAVNNFIKEKIKGDTWIGANQAQSDLPFRWTSDRSLIDFSDFHSGEPNNPHTEQCLEFYYFDNKYRWNDGKCYLKKPYICQK